MGGILLVAVIK